MSFFAAVISSRSGQERRYSAHWHCSKKKAKPNIKAYQLADSGGFSLFVKPAGSKGRCWKYLVDRKQNLISFGVSHRSALPTRASCAMRPTRFPVRNKLTIDDQLLAKAVMLTEPGIEKSELIRKCVKALIRRQTARCLAARGGQAPDIELALLRPDETVT